MTELAHEIISIDGATYGGSQRLFEEDAGMRRAGCGVIAAADLLLYLALYRPGCATALTGHPESNAIPLEQYKRLCRKLRRWLPIIPMLGKTGFDLALGLNAVFSHCSLPFRCSWCASYEKLFDRMEDMLRRDLPVIISVGQNFPLAWGREYLTLYAKTETGSLTPAARVKAHYMTLTGMDETTLRVSSWGREYYISRTEYTRYTRLHSLSLTSNIIFIKDHN